MCATPQAQGVKRAWVHPTACRFHVAATRAAKAISPGSLPLPGASRDLRLVESVLRADVLFWHCLELIVDSNEDVFLARVGGNGKD
jgi:hypothetical protein